jgi:hypothetical protein
MLSAIVTVAFWTAWGGFALMMLGMAMMWFAPVQTLAFRGRFKLSLWGALLMFGSVAVMIASALLDLQAALP